MEVKRSVSEHLLNDLWL